MSNEIDNLILYSVNISSQLILFFEKNIKNKIFNISVENRKILLNKIIFILKDNKEKTKLITKLFSLLPLLLIYNNNDDNDKKNYIEDLISILSIAYDYIQSDNLDKLRIAGLLCLDKIFRSIYLIVKKNNCNLFKDNEDLELITLKIIFLLLNDENGNIRKKTSEIIMTFNNLSNIIIIKDSQICFVNDYICQKILGKIDMNYEIFRKFAKYILDNNFYFRTNIFEKKVFYLEPDNNYIDNSQNKMIILKNILKNNFDVNKLGYKNEEIKENKSEDNKIMIVFEEFTDKVKIICNNIIMEKGDDKPEEPKYKYDKSMKYIYKNLIKPYIYSLN